MLLDDHLSGSIGEKSTVWNCARRPAARSFAFRQTDEPRPGAGATTGVAPALAETLGQIHFPKGPGAPMSFPDFSQTDRERRAVPGGRTRIEAVAAGRGRKTRLRPTTRISRPTNCLKIRAKPGSIRRSLQPARAFSSTRGWKKRAPRPPEGCGALYPERTATGLKQLCGRPLFYHRAHSRPRGLRAVHSHPRGYGDPGRTWSKWWPLPRACPGEIRPVNGHANAKEMSVGKRERELTAGGDGGTKGEGVRAPLSSSTRSEGRVLAERRQPRGGRAPGRARHPDTRVI